MITDIETMPAKEYLPKVIPIIQPVKRFEAIEDRIIKEERGFRYTQRQISSKYIPIIFTISMASFIWFFLMHHTAILKGHTGLLGLFCFLSSFAVPFFSFYFYFRGNVIKLQQKNAEKYELVAKSIQDEKLQAISAIWNDLNNYVPRNYWYSNAIVSFVDYMQNGRASNLKEAVNLFEEELHRMRMENMQAELVKQSRYQTSLAAISAVANVSTAMSASSAASSLRSML